MNKFASPLYWGSCDSPFGVMTVCCSEHGVRHLELGAMPAAEHAQNSTAARKITRANQRSDTPWIQARESPEPAAALVRQAISELQEYASGIRRQFSVPLELQGTDFQLRVWTALRNIPYGETRSYREVALAVGNSNACRAVGMANHWNPVAIMVPCHRVIAADGSLRGYAGGLDRKAQMLRLENPGGSHHCPQSATSRVL